MKCREFNCNERGKTFGVFSGIELCYCKKHKYIFNNFCVMVKKEHNKTLQREIPIFHSQK